MRLLKYWWNRISFWGVSEAVRSSDRVNVVLLNRTALVGLVVVALVYTKQFFINGAWFNPPAFVLVPLTFLVFFFHHRQWFVTARVFVNVLFPLIMTGIIIYYGEPLRVEYSFFIFITTAIVFFSQWWLRLLLILYNIILYLWSYFYALEHPSTQGYLITVTEPITFFLATAICISIIIGAYIDEIWRKEKQLESVLEDLQAKNDRLLGAYQEIERFAYITSHDLKTPLRNINSFIGLLERKLKAGKFDEVDEYMRYIKDGSRRMHDLIQDSLEYARIERLDSEAYEIIDLDQLTDEIRAELSAIYPRPIVLRKNHLPHIMGRRLHLHMLLQNLMENGVKYNDKTTVELRISCQQTKRGIQLDISDNGIGIEPAFQAQIFDIFKRLHTEEEYPGTGIGLSICKKIVEKMGGQILLDSLPGSGSTFSIELPMDKENIRTSQEVVAPF